VRDELSSFVAFPRLVGTRRSKRWHRHEGDDTRGLQHGRGSFGAHFDTDHGVDTADADHRRNGAADHY
jgi:hypothetical protein